jgi:hypothetical protein
MGPSSSYSSIFAAILAIVALASCEGTLEESRSRSSGSGTATGEIAEIKA